MKQKIYLSLNEEELEKLKIILEESPEHNLESVLNLPPAKANKDEYIRYYVYRSLSDLSGYKTSQIKDGSNLKSDLGLSLYHKRALKSYFQKILSDLDSTNIILVKECENLAKVKDCINLVKSRL